MTTVLLYASGVVLFALALFASIALHELGHLTVAKRLGCRVSQFMVGFGPTIWSTQRGETEVGIKLVPLGGYVKIIGMHPPLTELEHRIADGLETADGRLIEAAKQAAEDGKERRLTLREAFSRLISNSRIAEFELIERGDRDRLFYRLSPLRKIAVMLAGPAVNIMLAFVCFLGLFGLYGVRDVEPTGTTVVGSLSDCVLPVTEERTSCQDGDAVAPARAAGVEIGDEIVAVNGISVDSWDELSELIHANMDGSMQLTVIRDGETIQLQSVRTAAVDRQLVEGGDLVHVGFLGVGPEYEETVTRHGVLFTLEQMGQMTVNAAGTVIQLPVRVWHVGEAILGMQERAQDSPISVIGGSRIAGEVASSQSEELSWGDKGALLVSIIGSFNLFIGVFNLIPLMPLDGGQIAGAAWEGLRRRIARLRRRPDPGYVDVARQLPVAYCLVVVMVSMSAVIMIGDIVVPITTGL